MLNLAGYHAKNAQSLIQQNVFHASEGILSADKFVFQTFLAILAKLVHSVRLATIYLLELAINVMVE